MNRFNVALIQMDSQQDKAANIACRFVKHLLQRA